MKNIDFKIKIRKSRIKTPDITTIEEEFKNTKQPMVLIIDNKRV